MDAEFRDGAGRRDVVPRHHEELSSYQLSKEQGINPEKNLTALADLAASHPNVSLNRVIMAVNDAMMGVSTRPLALLGIRMHRDKGKGGMASFDYSTIGGKEVVERVPGNAQSVLSEIIKLSNMKYQGIALAQAQTLPGGIAQLKKLLYMFQAGVGGSGVVDWATGQINRLITVVNKASRDGSLARWQKQISDFMISTGNSIIKFVQATDWSAVGANLKIVGGAVAGIATALGTVATLGGGGISGLMNLFVATKVIGFTNAIVGLVSPLGTLAGVLLGLDVAVSPLAAITGGLGLLAGAMYLVYVRQRQLNGLSKAVSQTAQLVPKGYVRSTTGRLIQTKLVTAANIGGDSGYRVNLPVGPGGRLAPQAPPLLRRPAAGPAAGPAAKPFEGSLKIYVDGPQASAVQLRALQATGGTIQVNRGPIRAGG